MAPRPMGKKDAGPLHEGKVLPHPLLLPQRATSRGHVSGTRIKVSGIIQAKEQRHEDLQREIAINGRKTCESHRRSGSLSHTRRACDRRGVGGAGSEDVDELVSGCSAARVLPMYGGEVVTLFTAVGVVLGGRVGFGSWAEGGRVVMEREKACLLLQFASMVDGWSGPIPVAAEVI